MASAADPLPHTPREKKRRHQAKICHHFRVEQSNQDEQPDNYSSCSYEHYGDMNDDNESSDMRKFYNSEEDLLNSR